MCTKLQPFGDFCQNIIPSCLIQLKRDRLYSKISILTNIFSLSSNKNEFIKLSSLKNLKNMQNIILQKCYSIKQQFSLMANQSAKKNEAKNAVRVKLVTYGTAILIFWYLMFECLTGSILSIKSFIISALVIASSYFFAKQIIKSWELALPPEAYEYFVDLLALNALVMLLSPFTSYIWHAYWVIPGFLLILLGKWLWGYITPEYVPEQDEETKNKKTKKQQKKQKVKYVKA